VHRSEFIRELRVAFPEVESYLRGNRGGLHLEMSAFRQLVQDAMEAKNETKVRRYFGFIARAFETGNFRLRNAVTVSFLEELDFDAEGGRRALAVLPASLKETWEDLCRLFEKKGIAMTRSAGAWSEIKQRAVRGE
jgi:hypothetical protein